MKQGWMLRVDDRLIHGQVCVGWCGAMDINQLVLADDEIADSEFEQDLYLSCLGEDQELRFWSLERLAEELEDDASERTMVVVPALDALSRLKKMKASLPATIVLGGLHDRPGAREIADYLFLTPAQEKLLAELIDGGLNIIGQPLPSSPRLELRKLLAV